ncbi:hypothetical protein ASD39_03330 [Sphingomonas sp. Root50]|nr:hypothetical protein ASD17_02125 [Sphingomonas sp. Root1294]KQY69337.1 hypothetical protein ASD39_03330 [Sphingomonas sp. Root50]
MELLEMLQRNLDDVDLNDLYLTGLTLISPLYQPPGGLTFLNNSGLVVPRAGLFRRVENDIPHLDKQRCGHAIVAITSFLVWTDSALGETALCVYGTLAASRLSLGRSAVFLRGAMLSNRRLRSAVLKERLPGYQTLEEHLRIANIEERDPLVPLRPALVLVESEATRATINVENADFYGEDMILDRATLVVHGEFFGAKDSSLRGAVLHAPGLSRLRFALENYPKCLLVGRPNRWLGERSPDYYSSWHDYDEQVQASPTRPARPARVEQQEAKCADVLNRAEATLNDTSTEGDGIFLQNVDIRGADLSALPKIFLRLINVCADAATKFPKGLTVPACTGESLNYWDSIRACRRGQSQPNQIRACQHEAAGRIAKGRRVALSTLEPSGVFEGYLRFPLNLYAGLANDHLRDRYGRIAPHTDMLRVAQPQDKYRLVLEGSYTRYNADAGYRDNLFSRIEEPPSRWNPPEDWERPLVEPKRATLPSYEPKS